MKVFLLRVFLILTLLLANSNATSSQIRETSLIRRLYLDLLNVPPTPHEVDWLLIYHANNSFETAVCWILSKPELFSAESNKEACKQYLLSDAYKNKPKQKLTSEILKYIIEYQSGYNALSIKDSETMLIEMSIRWGGEDIIEVIDYMCVCLMSRSTNIDEANKLIKIFKNELQPFLGYKAVLAEIKTFDDFLTK
jgi:hypothetical protein